MQTIKTALAEAIKLLETKTEPALLDAEILLCKTLDKNRSYLRAWPDRELNQEQYETYKHLIKQRQIGQPIAYLIGYREFWSLDFYVSPDVLIPRPETELLIDLSLKLIPKGQAFKILDLGTGSGIIAITLAAEHPQTKITATDISLAALKIAQLNAERNKVNNIQFYHSHWFDNVTPGKFDLILSNPPYIAKDDQHLQEGDLRFEPKTALIADEDGLADIRTITETAYERLESGGYLMVEHGYNQEKNVRKLFIEMGYNRVQTYKDLNGLPRVTAGQYQ